MFDGEEDDSEADKNDEPQRGESSDSDDNDGMPVENQAVLEEGGGTKRKVKNKTKSTQQGKKRVVHANDWACNVRKHKLAGGYEYLSKKR